MKYLRDYKLLVLLLALSCLGMSCSENTRPENTTEKLFVAQWSLVGATNAVADLKGTLSADDYQNAKDIVLRAAIVLDCAKFASGVPGATAPAACPIVPDGSAASYLALLNSLLLEAARHTTSGGGSP